ncbi:phosphotransferase [Streptomyces sp. KR55]|uniref:phosphotransferase n=1 Tax=Streptomyces sp. KR55 TaxID=3457425 RepID=UPI003FD3745E
MWSRLPFGDELQADRGLPRRSRRLSSSPRSRVWRVELAAGPAVLEQIVTGNDADERYAREVAALRLASQAKAPVVPRRTGHRSGERVLVLQYLDHQRPSPDWIVGYAAALARLHASAGPEVVEVLPTISHERLWGTHVGFVAPPRSALKPRPYRQPDHCGHFRQLGAGSG